MFHVTLFHADGTRSSVIVDDQVTVEDARAVATSLTELPGVAYTIVQDADLVVVEHHGLAPVDLLRPGVKILWHSKLYRVRTGTVTRYPYTPRHGATARGERFDVPVVDMGTGRETSVRLYATSNVTVVD